MREKSEDNVMLSGKIIAISLTVLMILSVFAGVVMADVNNTNESKNINTVDKILSIIKSIFLGVKSDALAVEKHADVTEVNTRDQDKSATYTDDESTLVYNKTFDTETIIEKISNNPNFDGIITVSKDNFALSFYLQTKEGVTLWEIIPSSEWVMIPEESNITVVIIGKRYGKGYFSIDRVFYEGVSIYDEKGNLIKEITDTGKIREAKLLPDGNFILLTYNELRMIEASGNELWRVSTNAKRLWISEDGNFIVTILPILSPQGWESAVYDRGGNMIGSFSSEGSYWNMKFSLDANQLRIIVGEDQYVFNTSKGGYHASKK